MCQTSRCLSKSTNLILPDISITIKITVNTTYQGLASTPDAMITYLKHTSIPPLNPFHKSKIITNYDLQQNSLLFFIYHSIDLLILISRGKGVRLRARSYNIRLQDEAECFKRAAHLIRRHTVMQPAPFLLFFLLLGLGAMCNKK